MINKIYTNFDHKVNEFRHASPFPHLILDNFFTKNFFEKLEQGIVVNEEIDVKKKFSSIVENSKIIYQNNKLPFIEEINKELSKTKWLSVLRNLSGIEDLHAPDINYGSLSNYHEMNKNGLLGSHVDHSQHPIIKSKHVLNIIIYLSHDWQVEYGGKTLLYNKYGTKVIKEIDYIPNRAVIFLHTPYSFHGVSSVLNNEEVKRKTFYIDYYSNLKNPYTHLQLKFPNTFFKHGTTFILPTLVDYFKINNLKYTKTLVNYYLKRIF